MVTLTVTGRISALGGKFQPIQERLTVKSIVDQADEPFPP